MSGEKNFPSLLVPYTLPSAIISILFVLSLLFIENPVIGIKGLSALAGLLIASFIWYSQQLGGNTKKIFTCNSNILKIILSASLITIAFAFLGIPRFYILLGFYSVGLITLCISFRHQMNPKIGVSSIFLLFIVNPLTKYINTAFYFGGGDIFDHTRYIRELHTGYISSMSNYAYSRLPTLHVFTSIFSNVSGLSSYDSLLILGIFIYSGIVVLSTIIGKDIYGDKNALFVPLGFILIPPTHYFSTNFYPQSLAVAYLVTLLAFYLYAEKHPRIKWAIPVTGAATVLTHHLTPIFAGFVLFGFWTYHKLPITNTKGLQWGILVTISLASIAYNAFTHSFYNTLASFSVLLVKGVSVASEEGQTGPLQFGVNLEISTIQTALHSLITVGSFHQIALVGIIALSLVVLFDRWYDLNRRAPIFLSGVLGSTLIVQLPFKIPFSHRLGHLMSPFVAIFISLGIWRALDSKSKIRVLIAIFLVSTAGIASVLVVADDIRYEGDNNLMQNSYDKSEWVQLQSAAKFGEDSTPTVFWISREAFLYLGTSTAAPTDASNNGIQIERGLLLVRDNWTKHRVGIKAENSSLKKSIIGEETLEHEKTKHTKVYDAGEISYLYLDRRDTIFA